MASVEFSIKDEDINRINEAITNFEGNAERVINDYLGTQAKEKFIQSITNLIPVSRVNKKKTCKK